MTEQRAIMSSAGLQIHLQTHGSQSNASKHDQLTNKIALFSHPLLCTFILFYKIMKEIFRVTRSPLGYFDSCSTCHHVKGIEFLTMGQKLFTKAFYQCL